MAIPELPQLPPSRPAIEFADFVPSPARFEIERLLLGDSPDSAGILRNLEAAQQSLAELRSQFRAAVNGPNTQKLDQLRFECAEKEAHVTDLERERDFLFRLGSDQRMLDVYEELSGIRADERQVRAFLYSAWAALLDFQNHRARLNKAKSLAPEIVKTARELIGKLHKFTNAAGHYPDEVDSVRHLLGQTDNTELDGKNVYVWRWVRKNLLVNNGEPPPASNSDESTDPQFEKLRNDIRYAWGVSPSLSALIETMAKAVDGFQPYEHGMIGAAISLRQHNCHVAYYRAWAYLLETEHRMEPRRLCKSIAITTSVAFIKPGINISPESVRKNLKGCKSHGAS